MEMPHAEGDNDWLEDEQDFVDFFYDNFDVVVNGDGDSAAGDAGWPVKTFFTRL